MRLDKFSNKDLDSKGGKGGFTLLLAALVGSIVLALASAVFGIAMKQVALSSIGKNSQFAFYAADTAAECALFWDFRYSDTFAKSDALTPAPATSITCNQKVITIDTSPPSTQLEVDPNAATTTFQYDVTTIDGAVNKQYCAVVSVAKVRNPSTNGFNTVIYASGYSAACTAMNSAPDVLERVVRLRY